MNQPPTSLLSPLRQHRRILAAALVGTTVEFYDFYVFATATALVFGPLFFPAASPAAQGIYSFMAFGIAFVARPIGAVLFGHFGDRVGRKSTLVASLLLMGGCTFAIALLPAYASAGWLAPALLCTLRFGQGFGLGGEWGGAALLAVEYAPEGWHARFGAAPQLGAPIGFLAANGLFLILGVCLTPAEFLAWGWRVPFLLSAVLVGLGLWVRLRIAETPAFADAIARKTRVRVPLAYLLRRHFGVLMAGSAGVVACFALFYLATAFALSLGTGALGYNRTDFLLVQLGANLFFAVGIVLAAIWADKTRPGEVLGWGSVLTVLVGLAFGPGLLSGSLVWVFVTLSAALLVMGLVYGPLGGWLPTLFPVPLRYTGISLAFNLGGILGGALSPLAAEVLARGGWGAAVGLILAVAGLLALAGVSLARPAPVPAAA
ncbi:MAG TPA: MFS transporter [Novosphingobium sp.]|nr:MFS transporter [Novosphingobium sp.]